ncbi:MAG TPA: CehA/McbA family metallohydrolase [Myxococcota bacterium]|nr:CehA/McbA family metallohydrolase [Myxococcota bacterium]HRY92052.1 CehA/McbA family metallohydrolase [Myxococcota bacterium]HSA23445.1 CehA/McbA family metallohydrolase [Myxococcota bacterium]
MIARSSLVPGLMLLCLGGCDSGGGAPVRLPLDEPLGPGQVRAGRIALESELLQGPEAHGWLGDYKLYNARVAFVVQAIDAPRGWAPYGGTLLDADVTEPLPGGDPDQAREAFQELFAGFELQTLRPTSLELVADGADGAPAVVRVTGVDQGIPLIDAALAGTIEPMGLEVTLDYSLAPDSDHLVLTTELRVRGSSPLQCSVGDIVLNGDRTLDYMPGAGLLESGQVPSGEQAFFAGTNPSSCSLYTGRDGAPIRPRFSIENVTPLEVVAGLVPPARGEEPALRAERWLFVGRGGVDDCQRRLRRALGAEAEAGLVAGQVTAGGAPEGGAVVLAHDQGLQEGLAAAGQTFAGADGAFELELPAGSYRLEILAAGREPHWTAPFAVQAGQSHALQADLPAPARVAFTCSGRDREGAPTGPLPCKASLQPGLDAAMTAAVDTRLITFSVTGEGEVFVPPGDWTVTLSRGWEYSIHRQGVSVAAGERAEVRGELTRQVDTRGYIAADLHNHSARSADTDYELTDKIGSNAAEGVELLVATDHDCQTDLGPWVARLERATGADLGVWLRTVVGAEVSPLFGHFTAFPLPTHPTGWVYWQFPFVEYGADGRYARAREFPELWELVRAQGAEIVNVAHPLRDSGWFTHLGFEPPASMPAFADIPAGLWGTGFDTLELLNSSNVTDMLGSVLTLWSELNNRAFFRTAVGTSDSHGRTSEAGFGRTLVQSASDEPLAMDLAEIWANLRAGKALVGAGILVVLRVGEHTEGELIPAGAQVTAHLRVEAADWVPVERVDLLLNGAVVATRPLATPGLVDAAHPAVRLDEDLVLELTGDAWVAAVARGAEGASLDPVFRGDRPAGLSNAIRLDFDGDGQCQPVLP